MAVETDTRARLESYYDGFSPDVLDRVSEFAGRQAQFATYPEFLASVGIEDDFKKRKNRTILDIRPQGRDYDETCALAVELPMANPLDTNQAYQLATIAGVVADRPVIASANPSGWGYNANTLSWSDRRRVSKGHVEPTAETTLRHLEENGIIHVDGYGYSWAAKKIAALLGDQRRQFTSEALTVVEPVDVVWRGLLKLGLQFASTAGPMDGYVKANNMPTFEEARKDAVGAVAFNMGLLRPSNLAIARSLRHKAFVDEVRQAMSENHSLHSTVAWGSDSEMALDWGVADGTNKLGFYFHDRISKIRLPEQKHALANDIHLQAALVLQGLKNARAL